jgi:DNA-binding helix-hairpin-helix protein with protein kinase domain
MPRVVHTKLGVSITIEDNYLGKGGEGTIHRVISPSQYVGFCVKIYYEKHRTPEKTAKLNYMCQHPIGQARNPNFVICWPREIIYEDKNFVGFLMDLALPNSIDLVELCQPGFRPVLQHLPDWRSKFDRGSPSGISARLKICVNLAIAVHTVHHERKYVMIDMKPQNVLINLDGSVSITDLDSIQINGTPFLARFATPEYTPPEGNPNNPNKILGNAQVPVSWDLFSLAVIFYEVIFGLHPYAASYSLSGVTSTQDSIHRDLFVFGKNKDLILKKPALHDNFHILPQSIQILFVKAFDLSTMRTDLRPTAEEWGKTLTIEIYKGPSKGFKVIAPPQKNHDPVIVVPPSSSSSTVSPQPPVQQQSAGGCLSSIMYLFAYGAAFAVCRIILEFIMKLLEGR